MSRADLVSYPTEFGRDTSRAMAEDPAQALLCLDFDGTLAPIVADPSAARADPQAMAALGVLLTKLGRVAIVTGRPVDVVLQLGGFAQLPDTNSLQIFGQYGAETWNGRTGHITMPSAPPAIAAAYAQIEQMLDELIPAHPELIGTVLEDKGLAVGVHVRRAADPAAAQAELSGRLNNLADRLGLVTEPGRNVVELRASRSDKGAVVDQLLASDHTMSAAFCGDDLGDIAAFDAVERWRKRSGRPGACVVSASDEVPELGQRADVLCQGPAGIAEWLGSLAAACR